MTGSEKCGACGLVRGNKAMANEHRYSGGEHICWARDPKCMADAYQAVLARAESAEAERDAARKEVATLESLRSEFVRDAIESTRNRALKVALDVQKARVAKYEEALCRVLDDCGCDRLIPKEDCPVCSRVKVALAATPLPEVAPDDDPSSPHFDGAAAFKREVER